jgi:hypothetical protein
VSDSFTIVLWCADVARLASMAMSHLLAEGIHAVDHGRIDNPLPITVGVANSRRWPMFSREVSAKGIIRHRQPRVATAERHDFLLTVTSSQHVDAAGAPERVRQAPVIDANELLAALESLTPSGRDARELLKVFDSVAQPAKTTPSQREEKVDLHQIADCCQRLVSALAN